MVILYLWIISSRLRVILSCPRVMQIAAGHFELCLSLWPVLWVMIY